MILKSTRIVGDLRVARGGYIYTSGRINAPPLAIFEEPPTNIPENRPVLFSTGAETPAGTIKTSGTTIADGAIKVPEGVNSVSVNSDDLTIYASDISTTSTTIETQSATATAVTTCKKLDSVAPEWSSTDRVYIKEPVCYIYSSTQPRSDYIEASRSIGLVYPNEFITPTASALKKVTEYRLITDHTFSPN